MRTVRSTVLVPDASGAIHVPDGYDLAGLLELLNQRVQGGKPALHYAEFRRWVTKNEPLIFLMIYLPHHMRRPETSDLLSFSTMHVELDKAAKGWARSTGTSGHRLAVVGPRGSGKSTNLLVGHPLWAQAHGHKRFVAAFADSRDQIRRHMATLVSELENNELLRHDYPELCRPLMRGGRKAASSAESWQSECGAVMVARGLDAKSLGLKVGAVRPDLLILDDPEGGDGNYSEQQAQARLRTIRQGVLGMNPDAAVIWAGTSTVFGGLAHQLVRHATGEGTADWIAETGFNVRYFPALVTDPLTGAEHSLWEQRWSTEWLQDFRQRNPRDFFMDYQNTPIGADGKFWTRKDFVYDAHVPVKAWVMWVDPAVTANRTSDFTGISVVGRSSDGRCVVHLSEGLKGSVDEVRARVHQLVRVNPALRLVVVENNQGGTLWERALGPLPDRAELRMARAVVGKAERFADVHRLYREGRVVHAHAHPQLEDQACAFPYGKNDDVLDSACSAILYLTEADK